MRTMKWQAVSVMASSTNGLAREDAAAIVAVVDGITSALGRDLAPETLKAAEELVEALAREKDHAPLRRSAGNR
jgi:hypothetical protein